ncbi:MAG TPA: hypothetical protein VHE36_03195 [Sphingomicrobium sp.]|nr:hypothetical protein [Sphingomicrobium sp.]
MRFSRCVAAAFLLAASASPGSAQFSPEERAARQGATQKDYRETLHRLGLGPLRPGVDGLHADAQNAVNYDESKVGPIVLPPLLRMQDGRPVRTAADWKSKRRPELVELFDREVFGRVPRSAPSIHWDLAGTEQRSKAGLEVETRHYRGHSTADPKLEIQLDVTLPKGGRRKVPLVLELGFPEGFRFPGFNPQSSSGPDWTDEVILRGWGYAILVPYTVQGDDGAGLSQGVIGIAAKGRPRANDEWGALRAWAWGAGRAFDLFERDPRIDEGRIAIEGLSRYGKAALVTMAYDPRFSIGFIGSSGAGGAKLLRRNFGEQIENLAASGEYHWFAPNFLKYAGPMTVNDLPVDAHELIALVAPRPLFISAGTSENGDGWVDPRGSFEAARAASPAYRLLGARGLKGEDYPQVGELRDGGRIAFRQHPDGHSNALNWPAFLRFAERQWGLSR